MNKKRNNTLSKFAHQFLVTTVFLLYFSPPLSLSLHLIFILRKKINVEKINKHSFFHFFQRQNVTAAVSLVPQPFSVKKAKKQSRVKEVCVPPQPAYSQLRLLDEASCHNSASISVLQM
jgi:hypothetical protein